jgi:hypothetical protein
VYILLNYTFFPSSLVHFAAWDVLRLECFGFETFWIWDVLDLGRFEARDVLRFGAFVFGTFYSWDLRGLGRLQQGRFEAWGVLRLGPYVSGSFVFGTSSGRDVLS